MPTQENSFVRVDPPEEPVVRRFGIDYFPEEDKPENNELVYVCEYRGVLTLTKDTSGIVAEAICLPPSPKNACPNQFGCTKIAELTDSDTHKFSPFVYGREEVSN